MEQFEPISSPELFKRDDLQEQLSKGRITTVDGKYVYVANVVYAGVDMIDIHDVDIKTSTYVMDFYLWFRYRANSQDAEFKPASFVFTNAVSVDDSSYTPIRDPETINGITTFDMTGYAPGSGIDVSLPGLYRNNTFLLPEHGNVTVVFKFDQPVLPTSLP